MASLISTVGATDSNSYLSVASADAYFANSLNADAWTGDDVSDETKEKALVSATRLIDATLTFKGTRTATTQALSFPRVGIYRRDEAYFYNEDELPRELTHGTAETALALLEGDVSPFADPEDLNLKSIRAGSVAVEFDKSTPTRPLAASTFALIRHLVLSTGEPGIRTIKLVRV